MATVSQDMIDILTANRDGYLSQAAEHDRQVDYATEERDRANARADDLTRIIDELEAA